ncbi:MAG: hypothetical protein RR436_05455 [Clostridia bacterium]
MIILLAFGLCSCDTKQLTIEQSKKNYIVYEDSLQKVADKYDLKLTLKEDTNLQPQWYDKAFLITISSNIDIEIMLNNSASENKKETGAEWVTIRYKIRNEDTKADFNRELFVDLVNSVSGKNISIDFCNEFLDSPESKYASTKKGSKKLNGEIIAKSTSLNFFEDWNIFYELSKDSDEELTFGGLTKQLSK